MPALDPTAGIQEKVTENTRVANRLAEVLPDMVRFDPITGSVNLSEESVREVLKEAKVGDGPAEAFAHNMAASTERGMAVFGPSDDASRSTALPWTIVEDVAYTAQGLTTVLREDLGVERAKSAQEASTRLRQRFPNVDPDVFPEKGSAALLVRDPTWRAMRPPDNLDKIQPDPRTKPKGRSDRDRGRGSEEGSEEILAPTAQLLPRDPENGGGGGGGTGDSEPTPRPPVVRPPEWTSVVEAARCFLLQSQWTGWWDGWTGWVPGFKVCMDHNCSDKVANALLGAGGGNVLTQAINELLKQGLAAAIKWVATSAAVVLAVIGALLALNIKLVNGPNGACIWCNWPYTGGIVFWATSR